MRPGFRRRRLPNHSTIKLVWVTALLSALILSLITSIIGNPDTDLGFNDLNNRNIGLNKPTEISLALSGTGSPSDLGRLGFATGVIFDGPIKDDFAIFMTGSGSATAVARGPRCKV